MSVKVLNIIFCILFGHKVENERSAVFVVLQSAGGAHLRLKSLNSEAARGFYSQFGLKGMA